MCIVRKMPIIIGICPSIYSVNYPLIFGQNSFFFECSYYKNVQRYGFTKAHLQYNVLRSIIILCSCFLYINYFVLIAQRTKTILKQFLEIPFIFFFKYWAQEKHSFSHYYIKSKLLKCYCKQCEKLFKTQIALFKSTIPSVPNKLY